MRLIHESPDFWVLDKAPGEVVATRSGRGVRLGQDLIAESGGRLVHRLDKDTSGVLVVAKTQAAAVALSELFRSRRVAKAYDFLSREPPSASACELPIGADPRRPRRWTHRADGKAAHTEFESVGQVPGLAWTRARPTTGRTHQIRIHARALGAPILGDLDYGGVAATRVDGAVVRAERVMLHARRLAFPWAGEPKVFEADWPEDFSRLASLTSPTEGTSRR